MSDTERELMFKLHQIERTLQENGNDAEKLKQVVSDLRDVVQELDKDSAIQSEKQSHLFFRLEKIQEEVKTIKGKGEATNDKHRDVLENTLMIILGGIVTYFFSTFKG